MSEIGDSDNQQLGLLVPPGYVFDSLDPANRDLSSIFFGFALAVICFSLATAARQTRLMYKRYHTLKPYMFLVWGTWLSNIGMAVLTWTFMRRLFPPSFWVFFFIAFLWVFQIQLLFQVIINRLGLLMTSRRQAKRLSVYVIIVVGIINASVFVVWIPARLQISPTWILVNSIWDRIEKALICVIDVGLNVYFIWLVRVRLIDNGLRKYWPVYRVNCVMAVVSLILDIVLIGLMFAPNSLVYAQFQSMAYLCKLHIEMKMADLIVKVVRASTDDTYDWRSTTSQDKTDPSKQTAAATSHGKKSKGGASNKFGGTVQGNNTIIRADKDGIEMEDGPCGIQRTVETTVVIEDDQTSKTSSTEELRRHYGVDPHNTFEKV